MEGIEYLSGKYLDGSTRLRLVYESWLSHFDNAEAISNGLVLALTTANHNDLSSLATANHADLSSLTTANHSDLVSVAAAVDALKGGTPKTLMSLYDQLVSMANGKTIKDVFDNITTIAGGKTINDVNSSIASELALVRGGKDLSNIVALGGGKTTSDVMGGKSLSDIVTAVGAVETVCSSTLAELGTIINIARSGVAILDKDREVEPASPMFPSYVSEINYKNGTLSVGAEQLTLYIGSFTEEYWVEGVCSSYSYLAGVTWECMGTNEGSQTWTTISASVRRNCRLRDVAGLWHNAVVTLQTQSPMPNKTIWTYNYHRIGGESYALADECHDLEEYNTHYFKPMLLRIGDTIQLDFDRSGGIGKAGVLVMYRLWPASGERMLS